jgi:hypothetical protein
MPPLRPNPTPEFLRAPLRVALLFNNLEVFCFDAHVQAMILRLIMSRSQM